MKMSSFANVTLIFCSFVIQSSSTFAAEMDLSVYEAKFESLKNKSHELSPDLKSAVAFDAQKAAEQYTSITTHLPMLDLRFRKEKDFYEERNVPLRSLGVIFGAASWTVDYRWSLIDVAQFARTARVFKESDKAELDLQIKEKEFPITFTTLYLNYLLARYKSATLANSIKKAETGKKEAQMGFDLGQKTKIDVLRSNANFVSLNSRKTTYSVEEETAKSRLLVYSGLEEGDLKDTSPIDEDAIFSLIDNLSKGQGSKEAADIGRSPEYQEITLDEKINSLSTYEFVRQEYPTLSIQGTSVNSGETFDMAFHQPLRTHTIALVLNIPIFSSGSFASTHFEKHFANKRNEYIYRQQKQDLENDIKNQLTKVAALEELLESLTLNVSQYEELFRLSNKSYQLGKGSLFELLDVQDNLINAKIALAENKINYYNLSQNYLWKAGLQ
jgi:outer membrane protein TolC